MWAHMIKWSILDGAMGNVPRRECHGDLSIGSSLRGRLHPGDNTTERVSPTWPDTAVQMVRSLVRLLRPEGAA